jgi:2-iminoacetate synthase ThiH
MARFIGSQTTTSEMERPQLRVWIAHRSRSSHSMSFYAANSPADAADILENEGLGSMMAGLEELEEDGYHEWYDADGRDIDEWIEERDGEEN